MHARIAVKGFGASLQKLNGSYELGEENHGRASYRKIGGEDECCIYYWDEDDDMRGWWMAPTINGDEVWARNPRDNKFPPRGGWYAPWESETPDPKIVITFEPVKKAITTEPHKRPLPISEAQRPLPWAKKLKPDEELALFTKVAQTLTEVETTVAECEELVDQLKDTGVMFTCEVVDHMCPEEVLEMKKKADDVGKDAQQKMLSIKKMIDATRSDNDKCRSLGAKHTEAQGKLTALSKKLQEFTKEVNQIMMDANRGSQKAIQKQRQEEVDRAAREKTKKLEDAQMAQRMAVQKMTAFQIISKPMLATLASKSVKELRDDESTLLSMLEDIKKDTPLCNGHSLNVLRNTAMSLKPLVKKLQSKRVDLCLAEVAQVDQLGTKLALGIQSFMEKEKLSEDATFIRIAQTETKMTEAHLESFASTLDLGDLCAKQLISTLFGRAVLAASLGSGKEQETLTKDEFFLHIAHSLFTCKSTLMELQSPTKKKVKIEDGDIVEVLEGPVGEPLRARCKYLMDGSIGWIQFKFLQRLAPKFSVVQETVLTDRHELKGFAVIQRLRPGAKLVATKVPTVDPATKLLRVGVDLLVPGSPSVHGFVTVKGNRGAQLLKQEDDIPSDFGAGPVTAKALTNDDWAKMVSAHTNSIVEELVAGINEIDRLAPDCDEKCVTLEALADGWTADVLEETSKAAVEAWEKIDRLTQDLTNKLQIQSREIGNVSVDVQGPLSAIKSTVDDVQKRLQKAKSTHAETTQRARQLNKKLMNDLTVQIRKQELARQEEFMNTCINQCMARTEVVTGMVNRVTSEPDDEAGLLALQEAVAEGQEMVVSMRQWLDESRKEYPSKTNPNTELGKRLNELSSKVAKLNGLLAARHSKLGQLWADIIDKGAILVSKVLRDHMDMSAMSQADLFAHLSRETPGVLTLDALVNFIQELKLEVSSSTIEKIFNRISAKGSHKLSLDQFEFIVNCHYKVVRGTSMTDAIGVKDGSRVCGIKVDDCVKVLGLPVVDEATGAHRVHILFDGQEGYATMKGHLGAIFFQPISFYYKVTKDNVLTDKFEMSGFNVVRRLKVGEILRALSMPKQEPKSGLWRFEVVALLDKAKASTATASDHTGFVTAKGNQGNAFVESITIDGMSVEEPSGEKPCEAEVTEKEVAAKQEEIIEGPTQAETVDVVDTTMD